MKKSRMGCAICAAALAIVYSAIVSDRSTLAVRVLGAENESSTAPSIDGTWRWNFTMPNGTTSQPKLVLETDNDVLTGTTTFRPGAEAPITNAVLRGNQLRFQVIRSRADRTIVTTYSGIWSGKVIRGKVESNWAGQNRTYPWEARRKHDGAEGYWNWTVSLRGRKIPAQVRLAQRGDALTGYIPGSGRGTRLVRINRGSVTGDQVYFEIERGTGENRVVTIYSGQRKGDTIKGTMTTVVRGTKQEAPWLAKRAE